MDPKRSQSRQSAEIIAGNDDLLTELILLHLPARSLIKFKSVSKHWQSLISAPPFFAAYTNHHNSRRRENLQPSFILGTAAQPPEFFYFNPTTRVFLPYTFEHPYTKILQSSHGLLLLACRNSRCGRRVNYYVHNPTTRKSRKLEYYNYNNHNKSENMRTRILGISLSVDPSISPHYKIICTRRPNSSSNLICFEIYHSESDTWQHFTGGEFSLTPIGMRLMKALSCSNGIYWIRPGSRSYHFNIQTRRLENLHGNYVPPRRKIPFTYKTNYLVELNGRAHCVSVYSEKFGQEFKHLTIYELSLDHNSGWVEKFWADLNPFSEMKCPVWLLGIVRGDKEEYSSVLIRARGMIVCYWFFDKRYEVLCKFSSREIYDLQFDTELCHQFIESLVPV